MPGNRSIRSRPQLARGLAVFLIAFGIAYYGTFTYPDLLPARLLLGASPLSNLALVNGIVYGLVGLFVVSVLYRR